MGFRRPLTTQSFLLVEDGLMRLFWAFAIVAVALMGFAIYLSMFSHTQVGEGLERERPVQESHDDIPLWPMP